MSVQLKSIGEVFSITWELYKRRAVPILIVILLTSFLMIALVSCLAIIIILSFGGLQALAGGLQGEQLSPAVVAVVGAVVLVMTVLIIWSQAATVAVSVDENLGIMDGLRAGWTFFFPMTWVATLYMGIVMTGLSLFLVPGLILGLSMSLCFFTLVEEGLRGMDAVLASRLYMRGHWWNTFVKFFLVWLFSIVIGLIPFVGQLLSFIFTPFLLLYMVVVYRDLKEAAGEVDLHSGNRALWSLMAAAGIVLPLLGLVGAAVTLGPQLPEIMKQLQEGKVSGWELSGPDNPPAAQGSGRKSAAPVVKRLHSADGSWIWRDPIGDTSNSLLDIQKVSAVSGHGELLLTVTLSRPVEDYFAAAEAAAFDPLISFYLDTDVNRETGGRAVAESGRSGYDLIVDLLLETGPEDAVNGRVHAGVYSLDGSNRRSLAALDDTAVTVSGDTVKIRLPYKLLQVDRKDTLRICFREAGQEQGFGLAKDKLVPLQ